MLQDVLNNFDQKTLKTYNTTMILYKMKYKHKAYAVLEILLTWNQYEITR